MEDRFLDSFKNFIKGNPGKVLGTIVGLSVGVSFVWLGFWRTLILGLATYVGHTIGTWTDNEGKGLKEFLEEKFPGRPDFH